MSDFQTLGIKSRSERVAERIIHMIESGELRAGEKLQASLSSRSSWASAEAFFGRVWPS